MFQNIDHITKNKLFFNDSKRKRILLSGSKITISVIKGNNI